MLAEIWRNGILVRSVSGTRGHTMAREPVKLAMFGGNGTKKAGVSASKAHETLWVPCQLFGKKDAATRISLDVR